MKGVRPTGITAATDGEVLVVEFLDKKLLDSQRIEHIGREMEEAARNTIHKKLLLNFNGVSFMSSAMITKLAKLKKTCKELDVAVKLCHVAPNVLEVFQITKLNKIFDILLHSDQPPPGWKIPKQSSTSAHQSSPGPTSTVSSDNES